MRYIKRLIKKFLRQEILLTCGSYVIGCYIWLVFKTTQWRILGAHNVHQLITQKKPFIVVFWHNRLLMTCYAWAHWCPFYMLISKHYDGKLIAKTVGHFGIKAVQGSTNRGGIRAFRAMITLLKSGCTIGVTPDGPRGPAFSVSKGLGMLVRLSGACVIPLAYGTQRHLRLHTWDKFVFPFPFNKGKIVWGKPIMYADSTSDHTEKNMADFLTHVSVALNETTTLADSFVEPYQKRP